MQNHLFKEVTLGSRTGRQFPSPVLPVSSIASEPSSSLLSSVLSSFRPAHGSDDSHSLPACLWKLEAVCLAMLIFCYSYFLLVSLCWLFYFFDLLFSLHFSVIISLPYTIFHPHPHSLPPPPQPITTLLSMSMSSFHWVILNSKITY